MILGKEEKKLILDVLKGLRKLSFTNVPFTEALVLIRQLEDLAKAANDSTEFKIIEKEVVTDGEGNRQGDTAGATGQDPNP